AAPKTPSPLWGEEKHPQPDHDRPHRMTDLLTSALAPRSIAIIGASENIHKIGGRPISYMQRLGFQGRLYPINPSRSEIQGLRSYPSLADLPEVPELALVIVGGDQTMA